VDAGPDQNITLPADGKPGRFGKRMMAFPLQNGLDHVCGLKVNGPGYVTFSKRKNPTATSASFSSPGTYTFAD